MSNILTHAVFIGVLVIGEGLCLFSGNFDMSVVATMAFTAMIGAVLSGTGGSALGLQLNPGLSFLIMCLVGAGVGYANGLLVVRLNINPFIATFGMMIILGGITVLFTRGQAVTQLPYLFRAVGALTGGGLPLMVWIFLALYAVFYFVTSRTVMGRYLFAVGGNPVAAFQFGINAGRVVTGAFMISGCLAAVAGILLIGRMETATPLMGGGMLFEVIAAAVIGGISLSGGRGSIIGALGGVLLLSMIKTSLNLLAVSVFYVEVIRGLLILVAVVIDSLKMKYLAQ
jgi:ribose/xylose/arabinose/galactoside ABC-type transport system permease subunit